MIMEVYFMTNGMVVVFNGKGEQMNELQGHYDSVREKLFEAILKQSYRPVFYDQNAFQRLTDESRHDLRLV